MKEGRGSWVSRKEGRLSRKQGRMSSCCAGEVLEALSAADERLNSCCGWGIKNRRFRRVKTRFFLLCSLRDYDPRTRCRKRWLLNKREEIRIRIGTGTAISHTTPFFARNWKRAGTATSTEL